MRSNYEQKPVSKQKSNDGMLSIPMRKTGDEGVDAQIMEHYESIGYKFKEELKGGTIVLESPVAMQEKRAQDAIKLHMSRTGLAEDVSVERGNIIKNTNERQGKRSAADFMGEVLSSSVLSPSEPDFDEL